MNALGQLNAYLERLEKRLRLMAFSKGTSLVTIAALVMTVLLVWIINRYAFSPASLLWARILLFVSVATAISFGLAVPLLGLNRRAAARRAEERFPEFQERLLTLAEKPNSTDPFIELLAGDALRMAKSSEPARLAPTGPIVGFLTSAGVAVAVLLWLILAGPGYLGYGTSLLWAGAPKAGAHPFYDIVVSPGDRTVRRKADQLVTAQLIGFDSPKVRLFAQYRGASKWEPVDMQHSPQASTYEFLFSGLANPVEYYVEAGAVHSKHFNLRVIDLPAIQKIRVTYHYPAWSGLKDSVEDPGGDLRAVEGTEAEVAIQTDSPLSKGLLMLSDDKQVALKAREGNWLTARISIDKDGLYHVAAIEQGENVRMSEDFFIEARKDSPPSVKINRPGRDMKVNPLEEVTVAVSAEDDFGLNDVSLHYSVNGAPEKTVSLLGQKGVKTAEGSHLIALEDYRLSPGDLVSIYATARDARNTTKTDIYFVQAEPFERNYSQSQQAGGGGGMGGDDPQSEISQRQKDIIAATWNELKTSPKGSSNSAEDAKFLADLEDKLAAQAMSLVNRVKARQLGDTNPEFQSYSKNMEEASKAMTESAQRLRTQKFQDALPPEQQALQHALRAEDTFRDIQVAFGSRGGGGGMGGSMGRDLENLADLELDREKNQYETGQQSSSDSRAKEIDNALQKLAELARRQQELAAQKDQQQPFRQRWEQEMLRREAEQLQRQMEQLERGDSSQQSSQQGQAGQQGQQGQPAQSAQPGRGATGRSGSITDPHLRQAIERLQKAADDMRTAENQQNGQPDNAGQRRAAERLQEARDLLNGMQHQNASGQVDDMARRANQLAEQQAEFQNRLRQMVGNAGDTPRFNGQQPGSSQPQADKMAAEKDQMAEQLKQLEKDMSDAARSMAGAQNPVSNQLRNALSEAEQNEIELNMRRNAEYIRRGYGMSAWVRENTVTKGLNDLRDRLQRAQAAMEDQTQPGKGPGGDKNDIEKALAQVEAMRSRMQQLAQAQQNRRGAPGRNGNPQNGGQLQRGQDQGQSGQTGQPGQPGQPGQQPGQPGQPGSPQAGQSQGQGQSGGQPGAPGGQYGPGGLGTPSQAYGPYGGGGPVYPHNGYMGDGPVPLDQGYRESMRDLGQLRDFLKEHPEYIPDVQQLMRSLNPAYQNDGELTERLNREVLPNMERLELELRRALDDKNGDQVRSAGSETIPPGYSGAVADYFRKLSKGK